MSSVWLGLISWKWNETTNDDNTLRSEKVYVYTAPVFNMRPLSWFANAKINVCTTSFHPMITKRNIEKKKKDETKRNKMPDHLHHCVHTVHIVIFYYVRSFVRLRFFIYFHLIAHFCGLNVLYLWLVYWRTERKLCDFFRFILLLAFGYLCVRFFCFSLYYYAGKLDIFFLWYYYYWFVAKIGMAMISRSRIRNAKHFNIFHSSPPPELTQGENRKNAS